MHSTASDACNLTVLSKRIWTGQYPVCRPDEFKIHRAQRPHFKFTESQRPASTHFKFSNQIKSATSRIMCRSFLFLFGFQLSLIWCTGSTNRWRQRSFLKVGYDFLPIRITPLQTCKSCLITLKPWSSVSFDLCWCRMDFFPIETWIEG